jgi:hypothetical protein
MNGRLFYQQARNGKPVVSTRNLNFKYGNSPVAVDVQNRNQLAIHADGVLDPLVVNHFLVRSQSNATPYRDIPFQVTANGTLAALPGSSGNNDLTANLHLDLNHTLKERHESEPVQATEVNPWPNAPVQVPEEIPAGETPSPTPESAKPDMVSEAPGASRKQTFSLADLNPLHAVGYTAGLVKETVVTGFDILRHPKAYAEKLARIRPPKPKAEEQPVAEAPTPTAIAAAPETIPPEAAAPPEPQLAAGPPPDDNAYLNVQARLAGEDLTLQPGTLLHLFQAGNLLAEGTVHEVFIPDQRLMNMHVYTAPQISLDRLSHSTAENDFFKDAKGSLSMDLAFSDQGGQAVNGWLATDRLAVPYLTVQDLTGKFNFNGQSAVADIGNFAIPGIAAGAHATTEDIFAMPMMLDNVAIKGSLLSVASLQEFNDNVMKPIIVDQVMHNFARPSQGGDPALPFHFKDAAMAFDEVIFQNIILGNMTSKFSVYPNAFFELTDVSLQAAGGTATGYLSMSPNTRNYTTLELNATDIKANALTRALLNVTNQIFGDLDGTVRFTTYGANSDEMIQHANGTVNMKVTDGRLPAIAKVETLLSTANILRGGILGLNLGNLLRSLKVYDTNYFAELSGDLQLANGVMYTNNLVSDGENLDLFIQGNLAMANGNADLVVNGRMSQDVSGELGILGQLSLGRLLKLLPGIGSLGRNRTGLLGYIPGVGYVPGFGGPAKDFNWFQVRLVGDLNTPGAIQGFHWISAPNL